jgi:hypothetical protein
MILQNAPLPIQMQDLISEEFVLHQLQLRFEFVFLGLLFKPLFLFRGIRFLAVVELGVLTVEELAIGDVGSFLPGRVLSKN